MAIYMGKSIAVRFISIILLLLVIGQGVGAYLFLASIRSGFMDSLHARIQREVKQGATLLAEPAATYNTSMIEGYIAEVLKDQDIQAIRVLGRDGAPIKEQVTPQAKGQPYLLTEPILFMGDQVGSIKIEYAAKTIDNSMKKSLFLIPVYQGAMLVLVAIVLIRLFNANVKRPVQELNLAIERITGGDLAVAIPIERDDEIGTIANGVKFLAERLASTVARLNLLAEKVTGTIVQLDGTFARVKGVIENQNQSTDQVSIAIDSAGVGQQQIVANTEQLMSLSSDNLSTLLEIQANSEEIASTTENLTSNIRDSYATLTELTQSAKSITQLAEEVTSFIADASSSIEEVYRSVKNAESLTNESTQLSIQTTAVISDKGMAAIAQTTEGMQRIGNFIDTLMSSIEKLDDRSRDIGKILGVIDDVTEKSRLLSLNAQIIAAQAGDHGKGFAVVAEEMKQLSERAASSTKEISKIVNAIQAEIADVVTGTRTSVTVVRDGEIVVERTAGVLNEIQETSRQATDLAKGIERASMEQVNGLKLVVTATEQISEKIKEVGRATCEQEKNTAYLLNTLHPIKDGMEMTRRSTTEQANSSRFISGNIELANQKNSYIAAASHEQQELNEQVVVALDAVVGMGQTTLAEVNGLVPYLTALREDMDALRKEMALFKTASIPAAATVASQGDGEAEPAFEA